MIQYFQVHGAQAAESKITQSHMGKQFNWAYRQAFYTSPSVARICLFDAKFDAESGYQTFKKGVMQAIYLLVIPISCINGLIVVGLGLQTIIQLEMENKPRG